MKSVKKILSIVLIITITLTGIFLIPRNHTPDSFSKLNKGDNFILTMLRLGRPTDVTRGGIGLLHFEYQLEDESSVFLTFGYWLTGLETCVRYKDNEVLDRYVTKF